MSSRRQDENTIVSRRPLPHGVASGAIRKPTATNTSKENAVVARSTTGAGYVRSTAASTNKVTENVSSKRSLGAPEGFEKNAGKSASDRVGIKPTPTRRAPLASVLHPTLGTKTSTTNTNIRAPPSSTSTQKKSVLPQTSKLAPITAPTPSVKSQPHARTSSKAVVTRSRIPSASKPIRKKLSVYTPGPVTKAAAAVKSAGPATRWEEEDDDELEYMPPSVIETPHAPSDQYLPRRQGDIDEFSFGSTVTSAPEPSTQPKLKAYQKSVSSFDRGRGTRHHLSNVIPDVPIGDDVFDPKIQAIDEMFTLDD